MDRVVYLKFVKESKMRFVIVNVTTLIREVISREY